MIAKIVTGFKTMREAAFKTKVEVILSSMATAGLYYPTPSPALVDIAEAFDLYMQTWAIVEGGNNTQRQLMLQRKTILIDILMRLSAYVTFTANGNIAALQASGFTMAKDRSATPALAKPRNLKVNNAINNGSLEISVDTVEYAVVYLFQYITGTPGIDSNWLTKASTSKKCIINGLVSGAKYACRVAAIGQKDQITYSDFVYKIVE